MSDFERFVDWVDFLGIDPKQAFERAEYLLDHFGVEGVSCADQTMAYLNTGDTYSETLILDSEGLSVSTWGDWYESTEQVYCEEEGVIRCPFCGEFTPVEEQWRDTICESCDNRVGGMYA